MLRLSKPNVTLGLISKTTFVARRYAFTDIFTVTSLDLLI